MIHFKSVGSKELDREGDKSTREKVENDAKLNLINVNNDL
jgi:hypothetical protein